MPLGRLPPSTQLLEEQDTCGFDLGAACQPARGSQDLPAAPAPRPPVSALPPPPIPSRSQQLPSPTVWLPCKERGEKISLFPSAPPLRFGEGAGGRGSGTDSEPSPG